MVGVNVLKGQSGKKGKMFLRFSKLTFTVISVKSFRGILQVFLAKVNVSNAIMREIHRKFCSKKILCYKASNIYEMLVSENLERSSLK